MRINSDIWVKAYMRRCESGGASVYVVRRGDDVRGAVYIKVSRMDGTATLFGPAPSLAYGDAAERQWVRQHKDETRPERDIDQELARQIEFDNDIWIIEVEARGGQHFLDDWLAKSSPL
jgi:hypothetical protein